jgi:hypothetical protein
MPTDTQKRTRCVELLHTHPSMEREFRIPSDHVIIDKDTFDVLFQLHGRHVMPTHSANHGENNAQTF